MNDEKIYFFPKKSAKVSPSKKKTMKGVLLRPVPDHMTSSLKDAQDALDKLYSLPPITKEIEKHKAKRQKLQKERREDKNDAGKVLKEAERQIAKWERENTGYPLALF